MGPRYEKYEDFCIDSDYKPSCFESQAKAWQRLRETATREREEHARAQQKKRDDTQSDYQEVISDLQQALTTYNLEETRKCFKLLTEIDRYDELNLWEKNRALLKIYIHNTLHEAATAGKITIAQQIAAEVRTFDQEHLPKK